MNKNIYVFFITGALFPKDLINKVKIYLLDFYLISFTFDISLIRIVKYYE